VLFTILGRKGAGSGSAIARMAVLVWSAEGFAAMGGFEEKKVRQKPQRIFPLEGNRRIATYPSVVGEFRGVIGRRGQEFLTLRGGEIDIGHKSGGRFKGDS